jgi:hypothetical protein
MVVVGEVCCVVGDEECGIAPTKRYESGKTGVTKHIEIKAEIDSEDNNSGFDELCIV